MSSSPPHQPGPGRPPLSPESASAPEPKGVLAGGWKDSDRLLPIANIARIMKGTLPGNAKISKEAKEIVQECVSEFISFVASEASDRCAGDKRKTINGTDVLFAMEQLGFERYVEPLRVFLDKYREVRVSLRLAIDSVLSS